MVWRQQASSHFWKPWCIGFDSIEWYFTSVEAPPASIVNLLSYHEIRMFFVEPYLKNEHTNFTITHSAREISLLKCDHCHILNVLTLPFYIELQYWFNKWSDASRRQTNPWTDNDVDLDYYVNSIEYPSAFIVYHDILKCYVEPDLKKKRESQFHIDSFGKRFFSKEKIFFQTMCSELNSLLKVSISSRNVLTLAVGKTSLEPMLPKAMKHRAYEMNPTNSALTHLRLKN